MNFLGDFFIFKTFCVEINDTVYNVQLHKCKHTSIGNYFSNCNDIHSVPSRT